MTQQLATSVVSVTVYPGQARIVRQGQLTLSPGQSAQVLLTDLPLSLVHESVRVTGRGAGAITGIDVRIARHAVDDSARIAALLAERQRLAVAVQELADQRRALDLRATMLESVAAATGKPYARQVAAGQPTSGLTTIGDQLAEQLTVVLADRRTLLDREKELTDQQARIDRELGSGGDQGPDRVEVAVAMDPGDGGDLELEVSYLVDGASWEPRYDIRLDQEAGEVAVTWLGTVRQHTGEDWPACSLRLSTARPTAAITIPDLDPWFLTERPAPRPMPVAMAAAAPMMMDAERTMVGAARAKAAEPVPQTVATMEVGTTAATYVIEHPVAVPADGSDHQALITNFRLPARIDYVTAPVRGDDVFLRATVTNSSPHLLRAGRASLFHGTEFVGVSDLEVLACGEEVELALGLDDRIRVKRELIARHADKTFLGATARHEARWRTSVSNHSGKPARITVLDQAPVSQAPGITVRDIKTSPEAKTDEMGEITWQFELADGQQAQLELTVRIEVARGTTLSGWRE